MPSTDEDFLEASKSPTKVFLSAASNDNDLVIAQAELTSQKQGSRMYSTYRVSFFRKIAVLSNLANIVMSTCTHTSTDRRTATYKLKLKLI